MLVIVGTVCNEQLNLHYCRVTKQVGEETHVDGRVPIDSSGVVIVREIGIDGQESWHQRCDAEHIGDGFGGQQANCWRRLEESLLVDPHADGVGQYADDQ